MFDPPTWQGKLLFPKYLLFLSFCKGPLKTPRQLTNPLPQDALHTHVLFPSLNLSCRRDL